MSETFAPKSDAPELDHGTEDADEGARYEEAGKRFEREDGDEGEEAEPDWKAKHDQAEKRFQDQQKRAKAERREKQALAKRLEDLEAKFSKTSTGSDDDIDFGNEDEDPIGTIKGLKKLALSLKAREDADKQTSAKQQIENKRVQGLASTLQDSEADFRRLKPDYDQAVTHFKKARADELAEEGYSRDEIPGIMTRQFLDLIERADKTDRDPAEVVYALAMKRGYSVDAGKQKLQTIADGQKAGRSLSNTGGRNGDASTMTVGRAANLKGPALLKAYAQLREQEKRSSRR